MDPKKESKQVAEAKVLPLQVWETLDGTQQHLVLQVIIKLCCQLAEKWEEKQNEPATYQ